MHAARAADGRKFSLNRTALVPTDTSRPCSHPPAAYMVHFGELLTRQVTPDVTWSCRLKGHEGGPGAKQATRERHKGCVHRRAALIGVEFGGRSDRWRPRFAENVNPSRGRYTPLGVPTAANFHSIAMHSSPATQPDRARIPPLPEWCTSPSY